MKDATRWRSRAIGGGMKKPPAIPFQPWKFPYDTDGCPVVSERINHPKAN
jgi:hypothetical protein